MQVSNTHKRNVMYNYIYRDHPVMIKQGSTGLFFYVIANNNFCNTLLSKDREGNRDLEQACVIAESIVDDAINKRINKRITK